MAFEVFGAGAVQTAYVSYLSLDITGNSLTLLWPTSYVNAPYTNPSTGIHYNILAASMDVVTPINNVHTITLPNAMQSGVGQNFLIKNVGLSDFSLIDGGNSPILLATPGLTYWLQLTDNTTAAGIWKIETFAAGDSQVIAALLAGNGLIAIGNKLNTQIPVLPISVVPDPPINHTERAKIYIWTGGPATIPLPALGQVPDGFYVSFNNQGSGSLTINPFEVDTTIDNEPDVDVSVGQSLTIIKNLDKWWTLGFGQNQFAVVSELSLDVSAGVDITLTPLQSSNILQKYSGDFAANITIFFPPIKNYWYINNETTGAGSVSVQLAGPLGTKYFVSKGTKQIFYSDGLTISPLPTAVQLANGTNSRPALSFINDEHTGIFNNPPSSSIIFSIGGVIVGGFQKSEVDGLGAVVAISPGGTALQMISEDNDAYISYNGVTAIHITAAGVVALPAAPLPIASGGTGAINAPDAAIAILPSGAVSGDLLYFTGGAWTRLAMGAANQLLAVNGAGTALEWINP